MKIDSIMKEICKIVLMLFGGGFMGTLLLVLVYMLPTTPIKENVARSTKIYDYEGVYPQLIWGYRTTQLDNCTDATMLAEAMCPVEGNILENAMLVKHRMCSGEKLNYTMQMTCYANDADFPVREVNYPRYWHGYLVILKPLLSFFDVGDIRMFNFMIQSSLFLIILWKMAEKGMRTEAIGLVCGILVLNPLVTAVSFQNSTVYYVLLCSLVYLIGRNKLSGNYLYEKSCKYFFMILGMVTVYFDFLTYPLVALGVPLALLLHTTERGRTTNKVKHVCMCICMFAIGYLGLWGLKWVLASLITSANVLQDAWNQIMLRLNINNWEPDAAEVTIVGGIRKNLSIIARWPYFILIVGSMIIVTRGKLTLRSSKLIVYNAIPYIFVILIPFVHMLASAHTYSHYVFTYREFIFSIIAFIYMIMNMKREFMGENKSNEKII